MKIAALHLFLFTTLFITWMILSGYTSTFFIVSGIIGCGLSVWVYDRMLRIDGEKHLLIITPLTIGYGLWLTKEMLVCSFQVARLSLARRIDISPSLEWVESPLKSPTKHTIYANSITLTPGTVSVNAEMQEDGSARILVHALEKASIDELHAGAMADRIVKLTGKK